MANIIEKLADKLMAPAMRRDGARLDLKFAQESEERLADRLAFTKSPAVADLIVAMILKERDKQADAMERLGRRKEATVLRTDTDMRKGWTQ